MRMYYLLASISLFILEFFITLTHGFIRHTFGDFLAVILLYCIIKGLFAMEVLVAAIISLSIAFSLEFLQLTTLSELAIFHRYPILKLVLGTSFSWSDLIAYSFGFLFVLIAESFLIRKKI